jgi:hypothetical protein
MNPMTASFQFCHRWRKQSIGIIRVPVFIWRTGLSPIRSAQAD